jgi:hypothetical protein
MMKRNSEGAVGPQIAAGVGRLPRGAGRVDDPQRAHLVSPRHPALKSVRQTDYSPIYMPLPRTILEICLLRGRPQDMPTSPLLVALLALLSVVVDYLGGVGEPHGAQRVAIAALHTAAFGGVIWAALKLRGRPERWWQTIAALYAANVVVSLLLLPVLPQIAQLLEKGAEASPGWGVYVFIGGGLWFLMIMGQVMRQALDMPLLLSVLISIACMLVAFLLALLGTAVLLPLAPT